MMTERKKTIDELVKAAREYEHQKMMGKRPDDGRLAAARAAVLGIADDAQEMFDALMMALANVGGQPWAEWHFVASRALVRASGIETRSATDPKGRGPKDESPPGRP